MKSIGKDLALLSIFEEQDKFALTERANGFGPSGYRVVGHYYSIPMWKNF